MGKNRSTKKELHNKMFNSEDIDYTSIDSKFACDQIINVNKDKLLMFNSFNTELSKKEKIKHRMRIKLAEKEVLKTFKPCKRQLEW
jgi:hypothetical protein